ncbi:hypothetical protein ZEAMMB73_Zm00001d014262 [Zea mays]|uniref:Uncharacterized protein n=1 Tax=Zea mays TaxID=4577 RepID=A0A1D6GRI5_MAIZE|nr:hypothetical protein ZEAMMB73_Zm00001d014262 [Zea mays]
MAFDFTPRATPPHRVGTLLVFVSSRCYVPLQANGSNRCIFENQVYAWSQGVNHAIIRHNQPEVWAFCLGNGYAGLKDALGSNDSRLQSETLKPISEEVCNLDVVLSRFHFKEHQYSSSKI